MHQSILSTTRYRKSMARIPSVASIPPLIQLQKDSYEAFLQSKVQDVLAREDIGLQKVFSSIFPVEDYEGTASVQFVSYSLSEPKYTEEECRAKGLTYALTIRVLIRFVIWGVNPKNQERQVQGFKEQEVYLGEIPAMTSNGAFIINGVERVVVSQLHRSPGVIFDTDKGKSLGNKHLYSVRLIPYRGSWLDFEFDSKDILYCRLDRRRKFPATILFKALGYTTEELLSLFYNQESVLINQEGIFKKVHFEAYKGRPMPFDVIDPKTQKTIVPKGKKLTPLLLKKIKELNLNLVPVTAENLVNSVVAADVIDEKTGEVLLLANQELTANVIQWLQSLNTSLEFPVLVITEGTHDSSFRDTLALDGVVNQEEALLDLYRRARPGDPVSIEGARQFFSQLFFSPERYDLSDVGRLRLNEKLGRDLPLSHRTLTKEDIIMSIQHLYRVRGGEIQPDDIDHLGNRRVRVVGELVENQYRLGLTRVERAIRDRLQLQELSSFMPHDLMSAKPVAAVVKEFFGTSQLSQFMDQTNPLSEVYHKRRLSALGPGGLSRERAGFEVRDVHPTHYGRICPIETPEGPNIGLIVSLASFAQVNQYGFIETPYQKLKNCLPTNEIEYFNANTEWKTKPKIGQAMLALLTPEEIKQDPIVNAREAGESGSYRLSQLDYMDVSSVQPVSVASALIPFLQHDDAHRALMGANMQRQAVPLISPRAPLVGTGMEERVARDSGACVLARRSGVVVSVDSSKIVIRVKDVDLNNLDDTLYDVYELSKFARSNVDTCINQYPCVALNQEIQAGDVIADGFSTHWGELALGQNVMVGFMPWEGYNYEDAIVVSERLLKEDVFTSVHIQEFECVSRDTRLGREEITADIPNVPEHALAHLDEAGIIRIGASVKSGDILVGKVTPKVETQLTPEERLLRAVFGEKAADVKDSSLRVPPGVSGTVIGASVFARDSAEYDSRLNLQRTRQIEKFQRDEHEAIKFTLQSIRENIVTLLQETTLKEPFLYHNPKTGEEVEINKNEDFIEILPHLDLNKLLELKLKDHKSNLTLSRILKEAQKRITAIRENTKARIERVHEYDELPPGVIKMVKVYLAVRRRLRVGDKLSGRHGNKGVIAKIVPEEDMPYMPDGTKIDVLLSPLGVPSRMNIGQIMEVHLGLAAYGLGKKISRWLDEKKPRAEFEEFVLKIWNKPEEQKAIKELSDDAFFEFVSRYRNGVTFATPVFDGVTEEDIHYYLKLADLDPSGQSLLIDGRTGEMLDRPVTVGMMYIMKLHHLVDEKIHARSTGSYSLVTQQPLGGKAQFGGQRLGEMEVWALEAYGSAYSLQEFLTIKSDALRGRVEMYESIVRGEFNMKVETPESFNVLVKELQALALDMKLLRADKETKE